MEETVSEILQIFAPGILIDEYEIPTTNNNIIIKNCTYSNGKLNIINFLAKINKSNDSIEFKVGTTKYFALNQFDKNKICDFILHLELLGEELLLKYKQITKYLNAIPSSTSLTSYALVSSKSLSVYSSILIKNGKIIFEYKDTTKYTYSSISNLLANPLITQFKKSNIWNWL